MYRTRFNFGVSVLFVAAGMMVTGCQTHSDAPKSTQSTTPPKAPSSPRKGTKPPAKATALGANAQHTTPPANAKTQTPQEMTAKTANAAATKTLPPPQAKSPVSEKTAPVAKATSKPADKTPAVAKASLPVKSEKPVDTKLVAKVDKAKPTATPASTLSKTNGDTTSATQLTPVQEKLEQNTNLVGKVASRLPAGTDVIKAADGFANLNQFVAAVNVSNNLQVSFADLKAKLIDGKMSLGQAIQAVRPLTASPTIEAQRAEYDARGMITESEQPSQNTTSASTTMASNSPSPTTTATASKLKTKAKKPAQ